MAAPEETTKIDPRDSVRRTFRFEPKGDLTPEELDPAWALLKGKPLYPEDEQALGQAMRIPGK